MRLIYAEMYTQLRSYSMHAQHEKSPDLFTQIYSCIFMRHEATPIKWRPSPTRVELWVGKCSSSSAESEAERAQEDYISHEALQAANGDRCFGTSELSVSSGAQWSAVFLWF